MACLLPTLSHWPKSRAVPQVPSPIKMSMKKKSRDQSGRWAAV